MFRAHALASMNAPIQQPPVPQPQPATWQGTPQQPYVVGPPPHPKKDMTLALVSIGLAAAAWVTQAHLLASIPAIVIGFIAIAKMRKDPEKYDVKSGPWLGVIGIIMGAFNVLIIVGVVIFYILMVALQVSLGAF